MCSKLFAYKLMCWKMSAGEIRLAGLPERLGKQIFLQSKPACRVLTFLTFPTIYFCGIFCLFFRSKKCSLFSLSHECACVFETYDLSANRCYCWINFRPRGIHSMDVAWFYWRSGVIFLGVCLVVTTMSPAKTAEPIEMAVLPVQTRVGPRNLVLDGSTHWRHLVNAMDRSVRRRRCGLSLPLL